MRYRNARIEKDKDNTRYYRPTIVPNIPIKDSDIFVYPVYGERFDNMAQRYYGDSNLWWIIAKANELSKGDIAPKSDVKLRVPTVIEDILEAVHNSNS
jgi:hypothetical protein|tara:strand:- start:211 stop:504 length:294 start_codon:yes stop_codon:yes gene_type:complete